jgi:Zn-dependent M16 (insulinase) family peptidase
MYPVKGLEKKNNKELAEKLAAKKASFTEQQLLQIVEETKALKEYQEQENTPEELAKIPMLSREDLDKKALDFCTQESTYNGNKVLFHPVETNGVAYVRLAFDIRDIPARPEERSFKVTGY